MGEQDSKAIHSEIPRLILVSENFSKELTTCVMWLNDSWLRIAGQEIKCIRLQPHRNENEILVETTLVIPLPEATDYQTRLIERERETKNDSAKPQHIPGGSPFDESISKAQENRQQDLRSLYRCALCLEQRALAELSTYVNSKGDYVQLQLRLPGRKEFLVSFNNLLFSGGLGEISLWGGWRKLAPELQRQMEGLVGPIKSVSGVRHRRLSTAKTLENLEGILAVIGKAYEESVS